MTEPQRPPRLPQEKPAEATPRLAPVGPAGRSLLIMMQEGGRAEWKALTGAVLAALAALGAWQKLLLPGHATALFYTGVALIGIGLRQRQARTEAKLDTHLDQVRQSQGEQLEAIQLQLAAYLAAHPVPPVPPVAPVAPVAPVVPPVAPVAPPVIPLEPVSKEKRRE